ncbi:RHS repeat-associated core domain-containing protein [Yokenella regensburgei]|uniref:RHS repeat-associated core domain-containing protein n=1 Tax=Yokenella regensburgei TaxID=158877 RepID=UPI003ED9E5B7
MAATTQYTCTPVLNIRDNRGLFVRNINYHRHPDTPGNTEERIMHHHYGVHGFLTQSADPRLHGSRLANFIYLTDLTGNLLRTVSVDAGTTVVLNDAAGRPCMLVSNINTDENGVVDLNQAVTRTWQYEGNTLPGRPLSITEEATGDSARISERFVWAGNSEAEKAHNLVGQCVSHYDTAGLVQTSSLALSGAPLSVTRRLLKDADNPDTVADWQGADASAWNDLLETEAYTALTTVDATGAVLTTTDVKGNQQRAAYDVAGQPSGSWLTVKDGVEQSIVSSLTYSAAGKKLREEHGNGVVTTYTYEPQTQRLTGIKTERPAEHASGAKVLQDLCYEYDPVGNVLRVSNNAEVTRFWRNQKVAPENTYAYDTLYQLVSATGREMANAGQQGSGLPPLTVPLPTDSTVYTNYTRTYAYDTAGNLTQIRHSAPATNNNYTTSITVSDRSNRGVLSSLTENPAEVEALFTAGGLQRQLQPGQVLTWTPRNELLMVTPVVRDGNANDEESYRYDAGNRRLLKVSRQLTGGSTQTKRALYLPGLEHRTTLSGSTETESLQVLTVGEAGRAQVRVLHWESGRPDGITGDQIRYSYDNLTGSSGLELDGGGNVISMEEYYPYGGTSAWTARSAVEADYKTIRYSGQERDATGLYYYGARYYQPWAGRWLSSDPAGTVDGLNLYAFVGNNPLRYIDNGGFNKTDAERHEEIETFVTNLSSAIKVVDKQNKLLENAFLGRDLGIQTAKTVGYTVLSGAVGYGASIGGGIAGGLAGGALGSAIPIAGTAIGATAGAAAGAAGAKLAASKLTEFIGKKTDLDPNITPKAANLSWKKIKKSNTPYLTTEPINEFPIVNPAVVKNMGSDYLPTNSTGRDNLLTMGGAMAINELTGVGGKEIIKIGKLQKEAQDIGFGMTAEKIDKLNEAYVSLEKDVTAEYNQAIENFDELGVSMFHSPQGIIDIIIDKIKPPKIVDPLPDWITRDKVEKKMSVFRAKTQRAQENLARYRLKQGWAA